MEQQLINALENAERLEDIDDVSQMMIMARVTDALKQVRECTRQYLESIKAIQKEHTLELKLCRLTIVLNVTDDITDTLHKDVTQTCILGSKDKVLKNISQIIEVIHG